MAGCPPVRLGHGRWATARRADRRGPGQRGRSGRGGGVRDRPAVPAQGAGRRPAAVPPGAPEPGAGRGGPRSRGGRRGAGGRRAPALQGRLAEAGDAVRVAGQRGALRLPGPRGDPRAVRGARGAGGTGPGRPPGRRRHRSGPTPGGRVRPAAPARRGGARGHRARRRGGRGRRERGRPGAVRPHGARAGRALPHRPGRAGRPADEPGDADPAAGGVPGRRQPPRLPARWRDRGHGQLRQRDPGRAHREAHRRGRAARRPRLHPRLPGLRRAGRGDPRLLALPDTGAGVRPVAAGAAGEPRPGSLPGRRTGAPDHRRDRGASRAGRTTSRWDAAGPRWRAPARTWWSAGPEPSSWRVRASAARAGGIQLEVPSCPGPPGRDRWSSWRADLAQRGGAGRRRGGRGCGGRGRGGHRGGLLAAFPASGPDDPLRGAVVLARATRTASSAAACPGRRSEPCRAGSRRAWPWPTRSRSASRRRRSPPCWSSGSCWLGGLATGGRRRP